MIWSLVVGAGLLAFLGAGSESGRASAAKTAEEVQVQMVVPILMRHE